ncbi:conserved hypothetical protein [Tenacibaculum sp. 190524A02b]|uniref:Uncharacterized protein n=2 Tax=Tenacibaculum vairaonense TaxID=3137860 RepID=A0ABM9PPT3_9FLAO
MKLNPLKLDKQTIASLNDNQLKEVVGGVNHLKIAAGSTGCGSGASTCSSGGSTGCGSGASTCFAQL